MKEITRLMINEFKLKKLGYDFLGYKFVRNDASFHHLIIAHKDCKRLHTPCDGYTRGNGAILMQTTSHDYLHRIESADEEIFCEITSELIDENIKGYLDIDNLKRISMLLSYFEREHCSDRTSKGKILIKEEYTRRNKF